ncbi:MAG: hypothetical protein ACLTW9_28045 [Enterocloster sp.]
MKKFAFSLERMLTFPGVRIWKRRWAILGKDDRRAGCSWKPKNEIWQIRVRRRAGGYQTSAGGRGNDDIYAERPVSLYWKVQGIQLEEMEEELKLLQARAGDGSVRS